MSTTAELPALTGSPKQIAWATDIRAAALETVSGEPADWLARRFTAASWWIDNRHLARDGGWAALLGRYRRELMVASTTGPDQVPAWWYASAEELGEVPAAEFAETIRQCYDDQEWLDELVSEGIGWL